MRRVCVIANPASGRGRGSRVLSRLRPILAESGAAEIRVTSTRGDEQSMVRRALDDGFDTLIALGGDGTWGNVANGILGCGAGEQARLALLAAGTGNDFAKSVGVPASDIRATVRLALEGPDVRVDVGKIEEKYFLNVAGFGVDVAVIENLERTRLLTGNALYLVAGLRGVLGYAGLDAEIDAGPGFVASGRYLLLVIANGRNFAGVFPLAPGASTVDGQLDAIAIQDASRTRRLQLFLAAARGTHAQSAEVSVARAPRFRLRFDAPPAYETDGEYNVAGSREVEVSCVPRALRLVTPLSEASLGGHGPGHVQPAEAPQYRVG
jgi:diacylglycerol kinase (ATP)